MFEKEYVPLEEHDDQLDAAIRTMADYGRRAEEVGPEHISAMLADNSAEFLEIAATIIESFRRCEWPTKDHLKGFRILCDLKALLRPSSFHPDVQQGYSSMVDGILEITRKFPGIDAKNAGWQPEARAATPTSVHEAIPGEPEPDPQLVEALICLRQHYAVMPYVAPEDLFCALKNISSIAAHIGVSIQSIRWPTTMHMEGFRAMVALERDFGIIEQAGFVAVILLRMDLQKQIAQIIKKFPGIDANPSPIL